MQLTTRPERTGSPGSACHAPASCASCRFTQHHGFTPHRHLAILAASHGNPASRLLRAPSLKLRKTLYFLDHLNYMQHSKQIYRYIIKIKPNTDEDETDKEDIKGHKAPSTGVVAGATQEEYASVGALPLDMSKIPIGTKMFCNKPFSMEPIAAVGFQMECTLARYKFEQFGDLVYRNAIDKLVNKFYQPEEILQWRFDSKYMIRGLVLDKNKGNILKIDKYNSVEVAFHGLEIPLSKEEIANVYGNKMLIQDSFAEPDYATIDNVFSIVEAYLFAQLVTFKNKSGKAKYEVLHRDVRHAIDICCRDGCLEQEIQKDPSRYIHMEIRQA